MSHLVTMRVDPADTAVIYLCTDPSMGMIMGGFGPARYVGNTPPVKGASYAITSDDLARFRVYCTNRSVRIIDSRAPEPPVAPRVRPAWAERPLPECTQCGQPVARSAHPTFCPNCGAPWEAIEVGPGGARDRGLAPTRSCGSCGMSTPLAFTHCTKCGARADS